MTHSHSHPANANVNLLSIVTTAVAVVAYTWTTVREIKALTAMCDGLRQDLANLTFTYQEKVLPGLVETCAVLAEMKVQLAMKKDKNSA